MMVQLWDASTKYRFLLDINNVIVKETDRSGLFKALADEISKILQYDRFSINLYEPQSNKLSYFATADGIAPIGINETERPLAKGAIAKAVIRSRKPFIIEDLSKYSFWDSVQAMRNAGLNATMAYPLIVRNRVIGSIHFSFIKGPSKLTELNDFLTDLSRQVAIAVDNMLSYTELKTINEKLKQQKDILLSQTNETQRMGKFYYASNEMKAVMEEINLLAKSDVPVLITGETGTGKDHIAQYIHNLSHRSNSLFVKVNCPALTTSLFESELFGHAKGAYTGAHARRIGRFEMADGGTVFLDEIGALEMSLQAKFLNVIQFRAIERVGESRSINIDFRLISATNKNIEASITDNTFRSDLYYRLNAYALKIPPLRERIDDIPVLVEKLTIDQARSTHRIAPQYTAACIKSMTRYLWPGNVRELKNIVKRFVFMKSGEKITRQDFEAIIGGIRPQKSHKQLTLAEIERQHIIHALTRSGGVVGGPNGAAALLGLPRQTLQYRMKKYKIKPSIERRIF